VSCGARNRADCDDDLFTVTPLTFEDHFIALRTKLHALISGGVALGLALPGCSTASALEGN
jgi:hypothetical protein